MLGVKEHERGTTSFAAIAMAVVAICFEYRHQYAAMVHRNIGQRSSGRSDIGS
ncbi:hypothetical protein HFN80_31515 [Rhizobium laguerreae]|nr:hypothetical protein [Rhizobium laguerreae]